MRFFKTDFLEEAKQFVLGLDEKTSAKLLYNIGRAEQSNDPKLFKKLQDEIWEFRAQYLGLQVRLLAFWDKDGAEHTLVLATHGFIKKVSQVPSKELEKAKAKRLEYFAAKAARKSNDEKGSS